MSALLEPAAMAGPAMAGAISGDRGLGALLAPWKADLLSTYKHLVPVDQRLKDFRSIRGGIRYHSGQKEHRVAIARFGAGLKPLLEISKQL